MDKIRINLYDILLSLSNAIDLVTPKLSNHHQMVAYLAYRLAEQMELSVKELQEIIIEGLLHDIGALSIDERLTLIEEEPNTIDSHAFRGAKLLEECDLFLPYSRAIRYHHVQWNYGKGKKFMKDDIPLASHLLHLADRICVMIKPNNDVLSQIPDIISYAKNNRNHIFMPEAVDALLEISTKEHIWLELIYKSPLECIPDMSVFSIRDMEFDDLIQISKMFSHVIDFRSHSTATHSVAVASIAEKLGELAGFSTNECKMLVIAGHLHDLGKLAVDDSVLEKPSNLNRREYNIIRSHTFYTFQLLNKIDGFETINKWASYHHEKLNGKGYPFHLKGEDIPLGSRIMAVADIFTAITENRPYRKGMSNDEIIRIMTGMVKDGSICNNVVTLLLNNFNIFKNICEDSQITASEHFEQFFEESNDKSMISKI